MRKTLLTFLMATLVFGPLSFSPSFAHGPDGRHRDGGPRGEGGPRWNGGHQGESGPRWDRGPAPHRGQGPRFAHGHGEGRYDRFTWRGYDFRQGYPVPGPFRGERYWVRDWYGYGLPTPPRGHQWRDVDGNYVLIAVATGIITAVVLNNAFH